MHTGCPEKGYTLVELVIVISLMSLLLFAAIPRVVIGNGDGAARGALAKVAQQARKLKHLSFTQGRRYTMQIDLDRQRIEVWEFRADRNNALPHASLVLPETLRLIDVTTPAAESSTAGTSTIRFYPSGANDMAILHFEIDGLDSVSIRVEPFLPEVVIQEADETVDG
jgi:prepilin-type N-terminal cleavage/methylation domain-containing protein